jgi:predicted dehydrogenase
VRERFDRARLQVHQGTNSHFSADCRGKMIRVGVIGYGYWGPNIVRNLHGLDSTRVEMVCDMSPKALARVRKTHPGISTCSDSTEILTSTRWR